MPLDARPTAMVITLTCRHVGIAMPAEEGFEFVATDPDFELLDGSSFRRLEQLEQAARSMARVVKGSSSSEMIAVPITARLLWPAIVLRRRSYVRRVG